METRLLKDDFEEEKEALEGRITEILQDLAALEERYMKRESRPEDIARIKELELEMVDKDALVAKTKEEMLYFKREMLNREDNYNQKFNRAPNVGVMQVIKPKDGDSMKGKKGGRASINPGPPVGSGSAPSGQQQQMGMGIGGMGGMGIGGGRRGSGR